MSKPISVLGKRRAAAKVKRINAKTNTYEVIADSLILLGPSTPMVERPGVKIINIDGEEIEPTGRFLFTAETIDPYHYVIDMF